MEFIEKMYMIFEQYINSIIFFYLYISVKKIAVFKILEQ